MKLERQSKNHNWQAVGLAYILNDSMFAIWLILTILAMDESKTFSAKGSSVPMPPELLELYTLYQQELANRDQKEASYLSELNVMLRVDIL